MSADQKIRTVFYYASVAVFVIGLPFILAFALSYKFDSRNFKFTKTGIISLKTQPAGAAVLLDRNPLPEKTPMSITELLPGKYSLELEMEGYYPYTSDIEVEAGRVVRREKIILFPMRPDIQQVNKERISFFWPDEAKGAFYYVNRDDNMIYRSDFDGSRFEQMCAFIPITPLPRKWVVSPDRTKLFYFNNRQVGIVELPQGKKNGATQDSMVLNFPSDVINDAFWYSDNYHIILICSKRILICEARRDASPVTLVNLSKRSSTGFYDPHSDSLYFMDMQAAPDGNLYDNLYRLEMRNRVYPFSLPDFIKLKNIEQRMNLMDWRTGDKKDEKTQ
ncbi:MAG: PEGA domain-containing protein [Candidatus Omnitrophica bacterium]|nr:PEGA domain-containing protein [Candidatus Omnitrophota bacterium]